MSKDPQDMSSGHVVYAEGTWGARAVTDYLDREGWHYEFVPHKPTFRATAEARASGAMPAFTAKTVILRTRDGFVLAVLAASERLDLHKVRAVLHDSSVRLASEDEIGAAFPIFDVGAVPPLGSMLAVPQLLDKRLLQYSRVVASAGDHRHAVVLIPDELLRRGRSTPADIIEA